MIRLLILAFMLCSAAPSWAFLTDYGVYTEGPLTNPASAGGSVTDPVFGSQIYRMTDTADSSGSCQTPYSNRPAFNVNNTKFTALCNTGTNRMKVWDFNAATMARSNPRYQANRPTSLQDGQVQWSRTAYNIFYGTAVKSLYEITIPDGTSTTWTNTLIRDFSAECACTTISQLSISSDNDIFAFHYVTSGTANGYIAYKRSNNTILLNVNNEGTINEVEIDKSGRYLVALKTGNVLHVWDLNGTPARTTVTTANFFNHRGMGNGIVISSDGDNSKKLVTRNLATPNTVTALTANGTWTYGTNNDHFSMIGPDGWMLATRYKLDNTSITRVFDEEMVEVSTSGSGAVRRYAHTRSTLASAGPIQTNGVVSMNGAIGCWTTNWNAATSTTRMDVYCVKFIDIDTTPPTIPTATAAANGAGQITLTWTAATDASGISTYNIRRCSPTPCTPSTVIASVSGATLSYVNTGLTSSTSYAYTVNAVDPSNNQGTYSAQATATTGATFRTILSYDFFDRANNADIGTAWDAGYTGRNPFELVSNQVRVTAVNVNSLESYNAVTTPNDQWAAVEFTTYDGEGTRSVGTYARIASISNPYPEETAYDCRPFTAGLGSRIREITAGATVDLASETATVWQQGDWILCEVEGTSIRLSRIRGQSIERLLSTTDATLTDGKTAMAAFLQTTGNTPASVQIGKFVMGGYSGTAPVEASITAADATTTTATLTISGTPVWIRVETATVSVVELLSAFPGGVYTYPDTIKNSLTSQICFYPRNALGIENVAGSRCDTTIVPADTTPPVMSGATPSTELPVGTTSTLVSFVTNEAGVLCRYSTSNTTYALMSVDQHTLDASLTHSFTVTGLTNGSTTVYYAQCVDAFDNATVTPLTITIQVASATTDTTAPSTVTNLVATAISQTQIELVWSAATDAGGVAGYLIYLCGGAGCTDYTLAGQPVPSTSFVVALATATTYNFVVKAIDTSNNLSAANSNVATASTGSVIDVDPPSAMANLRVIGTFTTSAILAWNTGTDNVGVSSNIIEQCTGAGCSSFAIIVAVSGTSTTIAGLAASTTYCWRGKHSDGANVSTSYSSTVCGTTQAASTTALTQPRETGIPRATATTREVRQ